MIEGVDCASTITNPNALKAAGKHFACRYLSTAGNPKNLKATEATSLHAAGIQVVTVFETTANRALAGRAAGIQDAQSASVQARELGAPTDVPIYFAVDFDMQANQDVAVSAYFDGCVAQLGHDRVGGYGGLRLMQILDGHVKYLWQTLAWSGGVWHKAAQLQQYRNGQSVAGLSVDLDRAITADYGQWARPQPVKHWPKPTHYRVSYTALDGSRKHLEPMRHTTLWQIRHPKARSRAPGLHIVPVFPKK